jgi:ATP-binding cassette subfamily F protein 3
MSLVILESAGLSYAARTLFADLNLRVGEEDRIGVVGRNGSGKSSLLRVIAGEVEPTDGTVRGSRGLRLGYLPQDLEIEGGRGLLASVLGSVPGRQDLEESLEVVEEQLAVATEHDEQMELAEKLADLHEELAHFDAAYSRHEALAILDGLGFRQTDMDRDLSEFSGGWRMRAVLAGLLFQRPDLLLLDEPTNHLDVPSVTWLGEFLKRYRRAFMLICHDREFLNEQISRVVAFETEGVRQYSGDYETYKLARAEELKILERRAANIAREKEQAERFIRRFRAQATKARAVQSRIKAVERMEEIVLPDGDKTLDFTFPPAQRAGQDIVSFRSVSHSYGELEVFGGVSLTVRRGDRIAILGANGNGKTTLLKLMAGAMAPTTGEVKLGHNVQVGYYAQHVTELLDSRSSIVDEVWRNSAIDDITRVRTALGTMLFSGDDVDKRIGVLSGGEKARVALARIMVNPGNLLIMDEPTNHLDLESSEALARALESFDGTIVFASHNRSFVRRLAKRIWNVEDGHVEEFPGTLAEYMHHCSVVQHAREGSSNGGTSGRAPADAGPKRDRSSPPARSSKSKPGKNAAGRRRPSGGKRRTAANGEPIKVVQGRVADLEKRIANIEAAQSERSAELSKPEVYDDGGRYSELLSAYRSDAEKLEELMARWEHAQSLLGEDRE